jgi:hypothetical protein
MELQIRQRNEKKAKAVYRKGIFFRDKENNEKQFTGKTKK